MNKILATVGMMAGLGMLLVACSGANTCRMSCPRPAWVDKPPVLGAVGYKQGINVGTARTLAEDDARQKIAREISVKVAGLLEQSLQQVLGPEGEKTGHEYAEGITRTLHKNLISGSRVSEYWEDCCDGGMYALVTIEKEALMEAANAQAKAAAEKLLAQAEEKHEELSQKFNELLEKEYGK